MSGNSWGKGRRRGEPSRLLECRLERLQVAGSDQFGSQSSVRLWLGPLFPVPSRKPLHRGTEREKEAQRAWKRHAGFRMLRGRLHNPFLVAAPEAGSTDQ